MADEKTLKDLMDVESLDEFEARAVSVFQKIKEKGETELGELKEALKSVFNVLEGSAQTQDYFDQSDNLENIRQKTSEIVKELLKKKQLSQEEIQYLNIIASLAEESVKVNGQNLILEDNINKQLRIRVGLIDELATGSMLITKYTLQNLKGYSDMISPINVVRRIQQDLSEMTAEQAQIFIQGTMIKKMGEISNVFMKMVGSLSIIKAEFNKLTTNTETYLDNVRVAAKEVSGLSFEEAAATTKELINGMSQFTKLTEDTRTELVKTVATMDKLGLSTQNQVMLLQMTTKSFGMSIAQAESSLTKMQSFAESTGIPMSELNKNLGAVGTKLANFGQQGYERVFQSLSVAAKNLGIEMSKLLATTEGFTTFEGAAQAAGQLNAVLGGNFINSISLLEASMENPIEAFSRIKEAMDASGQSFSDMSLPMQRHIASLLNMEVSEAQALFSQSLGSATSQMRAQAKQQEELNALAAKSTDAFKRLEIAFQKIVASPVTQWIITIVENIVGFIEAVLEFPLIGPVITGIITLIATLAMGMIALNSVVSTATMAWTLLSKAQAISFLADNKWLGKMAEWVAAKLTKIGLLKAEGDAEMVKSAQTAAANATTSGSFATMAATLGPLTPVLYAVAGVILAIGAAVALTGLGVMLITEGFAALLPIMVETGTSGWDLTGMFLGLIVSLAIFIGTMTYLAPGAFAAAAGIGVLGLALAALALGFIGILPYFERYMDKKIKLKEEEKKYAEQVNQTFTSLQNFASILQKLETFNPFTVFAQGIAQISAEIENLDVEKLSMLSSLTQPFGAVGLGINTTTPPSAIAAENIVSVRVVEIQTRTEAQEVAKQQMSNKASADNKSSSSQINLSINSPVMLGNTRFGEMIYNGFAMLEKQKTGDDLGRIIVRDDELLLI